MPNYTLALLDSATSLEPDKIYCSITSGGGAAAAAAGLGARLTYKIPQEDGSVAEGSMTSEQLGVDIATLSTLDTIEPYLETIKDIAAAAGHIIVETTTLLTEHVYDADVEIGVNISTSPDPADPEYAYVIPDIYVKGKPTKPRTVVMVVDVSGSMAGLGIDGIHKTLPELFERLNPDDSITLVKFSKTVNDVIDNQKKSVLATATAGGAGTLSRFNAAVQGLVSAGGTALNDAILSVASKKEGLCPGHTTVLLFTDGQEGGSTYTGAPAAVITEYNARFEGKAPRIFPIGLGASYDHGFMKACAIAANYGMIDARDQARMSEHVDAMVNGLAYGIPVDLQIGDSTVHLGTLNYNTANKQTPIRVPRAALSAGLTIDIAGKKHTIPPTSFAEATESQRRQRMQSYLIQEGKRIYDTPETSMTLDQKMDAIEALMEIQGSLLNHGTRQELNTLLQVLDKKALVAKGHNILARPVAGASVADVLQNALRIGELKPRYEENRTYLEDTVRRLSLSARGGTDFMATLMTSVARKPGQTSITAIDVVEDSAAHNRFTGLSSLTSSVFRGGLTLSAPRAYRREIKNDTFILDRGFDFSKSTPDQVVVSEFHCQRPAKRERVILKMGDAYLEEGVAAIVAGGTTSAPAEALLRRVMEHVRSTMPNSDLSRIGLGSGSIKTDVNLEECIRTGTGVCRHMSFYTAALLGKLAHGFSGTVKATHYRAVDNNLRAHSVALLTQTVEGVTTHFIVDPALNVYQKIQTQADFEGCIAIYNAKDLHWFLRNFAKDHGFTYPDAEAAIPIGERPIAQLQLLAELNLDVMNELRRCGLVPTGSSTITQTPENKRLLWERLAHYGCIIPEEVTTPAAATAVPAVTVPTAPAAITASAAIVPTVPAATSGAGEPKMESEIVRSLRDKLKFYLEMDAMNPLKLHLAANTLLDKIHKATETFENTPNLAVYKRTCTDAISDAEKIFEAHGGNTFWQKNIAPWINWLFSCFESCRKARAEERQVKSALQELSLFRSDVTVMEEDLTEFDILGPTGD